MKMTNFVSFPPLKTKPSQLSYFQRLDISSSSINVNNLSQQLSIYPSPIFSIGDGATSLVRNFTNVDHGETSRRNSRFGEMVRNGRKVRVIPVE